MRNVVIIFWITAIGAAMGAWGWIEMRKSDLRAEAMAEADAKAEERANELAVMEDALVPLRAQSDALQATMTPEAASAFQAAREMVEETVLKNRNGEISFGGKDLTHIPWEVAALSRRSVGIYDTSITDLEPLRAMGSMSDEGRNGVSGLTISNSPIESFEPVAEAGLYHVELSNMELPPMETFGKGAFELSLQSVRYDNWPAMSALTDLRELKIFDADTDDLSFLINMRLLGKLWLERIPARDLTPIREMAAAERSLSTLTLKSMNVNGPDDFLSRFNNLYVLDLVNINVEQLTDFYGGDTLGFVGLVNTQVSDLGFIDRPGVLRHAYLQGSPVSDISILAGATRLEDLNLSDTLVTDWSMIPQSALDGGLRIVTEGY